MDLVFIYFLSLLFLFSIFPFILFLVFFSFFLNLGKKYNVILYVTVTQVTRHDRGVTPVTGRSLYVTVIGHTIT